MDAFYASVEQRDNPSYRGKPLAVGYGGKRGVVAAASYEARRYGVRSAMPSVTALRKCPRLIFVAPRFAFYRELSHQIMQIFLEYTDRVEPLSLDEAFLDVTENKKGLASATLIAKEIKAKIFGETHLTASAGVSYNKFLAKIASDYKKPDGLFVIQPHQASGFIEELPVERFWGVGKVTAARMKELGIHRGADLRRWTESDLVKCFGKAGSIYYHFARGVDNRPVEPERIRKSLGAEETFPEDLYRAEELSEALTRIADEVYRRAEKRDFFAKTLTLKIKYADFSIITRSKTADNEIRSEEQLIALAKELFQQVEDIPERKVRLLGLSLKNIPHEHRPIHNLPVQLTLRFRD